MILKENLGGGMEKTAVYPGTFDPVTNGHIDIIKRALRLFDFVIVAITDNPYKEPFFTIEERKSFILQSTKGLKNLKVDYFDDLLVNYCKRQKGAVIIRGLRAVSDFEYEFQMALMNRKLSDSIETVFMMPSDKYTYLSSRLVKEVASFGGDVSGVVPEVVADGLRRRFKEVASKRGDFKPFFVERD